jgi:hypothetical protein
MHRFSRRRPIAALAAASLTTGLLVATAALSAAPASAFTGAESLGCRLYFGDAGAGSSPSTYNDTFSLTLSPASASVGDSVTATFSGVTGTINGPVPIEANTLRVVAIVNVSGSQSGDLVLGDPAAPGFYPSPAAVAANDTQTEGFLDPGAPLGAYSVSGSFTTTAAGNVDVALKRLKFDAVSTSPATNVDTYCTDASTASPGGVDPKASPVVSSVILQSLTVAGAVSAPSAPTGVTAVAGDTQASVSWTAGSTGGSPITGYEVTASPGGQSCSTSGATSCTVTGLTNGQAYTFTVVATNVEGDSPSSSPSNSVTPAAATAPGMPTSVSGTRGDSKVSVAWTAPASNGGATITGYTVTSSPEDKTCITSGALTCEVTGLTNGTAYTFTVTATNAAGTSGPSTPSAAVTPRAPGPPGAPTAVSAVAGDKEAQVSWTAPTDDGDSPITGYTVTSSPSPTGTGSALASTAAVSAGTCTTTGETTCTVTGLTNGTAYTFAVTAANALGSSPASAPSAAVTPAGASVPAVPVPDVICQVLTSAPATPVAWETASPNSSATDSPTPTMAFAASQLTVEAGDVVTVALQYSQGPQSGPVPIGPGVVRPMASVSVTGASTGTLLLEGPAFGAIDPYSWIPGATMTGEFTATAAGEITFTLDDIAFDYGDEESGAAFSWPDTVEEFDTVCNKGAEPKFSPVPIGLVAVEGTVPDDSSGGGGGSGDGDGDDSGDGSGDDNGGTLPQTGPEDFAMTLLWGLVVLQIGLVLAVRSARRRRTPARARHAGRTR